MTRVTFYDVAPDRRLDRIATLAAAAWDRGRTLLVHCGGARDAQAVDERLWTFKEESFIPHEVARKGQPLQDEDAKIVIVTGEHDPIGADVLVQEAPVSPEFARRFDFVVDLVDHRSPQALAASRARFKAWRDAGADPAYKKG